MGITCACTGNENDEEMISRILNKMVLSEIDIIATYDEFRRTMTTDKHIDYFKFFNYMKKIIGEDNAYKQVQYAFFDNLRKREANLNNVKRIGLMLIFLAKGSLFAKITTLTKHFISYYDTSSEKLDSSVQELIVDLIDCNTENCLNSFKKVLDTDSYTNLNEIWSKNRRKKLMYKILVNYDCVKNRKLLGCNDKLNETEGSFNIVPKINNKEDEQIVQLETSSRETVINKKINEDDLKLIKEFFELSFNQLKGENIRSWLYEEYIKDKKYEEQIE